MGIPAPYPWFGGKRRIAHEIWRRFGDVTNFVDPFFGSGAGLLERPLPFKGTETINDLDGLVANFWRATQRDWKAVAKHADNPVNENDLHARHAWLVGVKDSLQATLEGDPDYYDAKIAGWWVWGIACWIGSGFCSGKGPWQVVEVDGTRQLVHLGSAGRGVNRQLVHLSNAGRGVNRKRVHLSSAGQGVNRQRGRRAALYEYFRALRRRMRNVRVCCGDWTRVMGGDTGEALRCHFASGQTCAILLDPPYADTAKRDITLYRQESLTVAHDVKAWAVKHGNDPRYRIALCGYDGEHDMPGDWVPVSWSAQGGYAHQGNGRGKSNRHKERVWFSPHCLPGNDAIEIDPATCRPRSERSLWDEVPA